VHAGPLVPSRAIAVPAARLVRDIDDPGALAGYPGGLSKADMDFLPRTWPEWGLCLGAYLVGAIPFGLLLGFAVKGVDIRGVGSGNIGAANVGRALGRPFALFAFLLDFLKGYGPAWAALVLTDPTRAKSLAVVCGGAAVCGHVWPIYLRFRGGKGVATGTGALVAIDPILFVFGGVVWLVTLGLTRFVGFSSMMMGLAFFVAAWWRSAEGAYGHVVVVGAALLAALVWIRHRGNMARMLAGTEPRFGSKRAENAAPRGGGR